MIHFSCFGCGKPVSSPLPPDAVLRAIAWCPECVEQRKDQRITPDDAQTLLFALEHGNGNEDPDQELLRSRLREIAEP